MGDVLDFIQEEVLGDVFGIRPDQPEPAPPADQSADDLDKQREARRRIREEAGGGGIVGPLGVIAPELEVSAAGPRRLRGSPDVFSMLTGGP